MSELPEIIHNKKWRIALRAGAVILGIGIGFFLVFQVLFLYRVLPHGGVW